MKKTTIILCALAATVLFARCAKKTTPTGAAKQTPTEEIAELKNKYTPADMAAGKAIFTAKCADCHKLEQPEDFTVKRWHKILPDMIDKAKITGHDAEVLRAWVITNAKPA